MFITFAEQEREVYLFKQERLSLRHFVITNTLIEWNWYRCEKLDNKLVILYKFHVSYQITTREFWIRFDIFALEVC